MPKQLYTNPVTGQPFIPRLNVPEIFGNDLSYSDQIQMLAAYVSNELSALDYVTQEDLTQAIQAVNDNLAGTASAIRLELVNATGELQRQIDAISAGFEVYDISAGAYRVNQDAMRALGNFLTVHAITCGELAKMEITAGQLRDSGINVHGLAVLGIWLVSKGFTLPDRFLPQQRRTGTVVTTNDLMDLTVDENRFVRLE